MASNVNALLINFAVLVGDVRVKDIISVAGFDMGSEGTLEVPEDDRTAKISNGRRSVPDFGMKYRLIKGTQFDGGTHKFFYDWWVNRAGDNRTITVVWLERDRKTEIFRWIWKDCEFVKFTGEDQDYSSPKLGVLDVGFLPYDVIHSIASAGQIFSA